MEEQREAGHYMLNNGGKSGGKSATASLIFFVISDVITIVKLKTWAPCALTAFIGFPFALVSYTVYVHGMRYLHHKVHELDGYNYEFWKTLKCVLELVASTSHAKVPSKAPHSTGLSRTSSKT